MNRISDTAKIGQNGFRYDRDDTGKLVELPHSFKVVLGDDITISEFVTVDRGRWRDTVIKDNTKIDHYAHIAHNVIVGKSCLIHAHVNLCGSVEIGDFTEVFPQCNIAPLVHIGHHSVIASNSFVKDHVGNYELWAGTPARFIRSLK